MLSFTFCPVPIWMTACLNNKQHARWLILKTEKAKCSFYIRFSWSRICYAFGSFLNVPSWLPPFASPSLSFSFLQPQTVSGNSQGSWNENVWNENEMSESRLWHSDESSAHCCLIVKWAPFITKSSTSILGMEENVTLQRVFLVGILVPIWFF